MEFVPLTAEQRHQFDTEGYLIVKNALSQTQVANVIAASDRLVASDVTENRQRNGDGQYDGFRNAIAMDDAYLPLLTNPKTVSLVVQLLGPHIHMVTSHLIYKSAAPAGTPPETRDPGWHRDIGGMPGDIGHAHIPRMEMKVAYYLTDLSKPNSGVTLFSPGSNHLKHAMPIPKGRVDPENVVEPSLEPGDAVLFENRTYHAATANLSGYTRKCIMFGYGHMWMQPMDYRIQADSLANKLDPIGQQLIGALKAPDGSFVPGGINTPLREWCKANNFAYTPPD